jgi:calcineurin-like phosphoesterase family protein
MDNESRGSGNDLLYFTSDLHFDHKHVIGYSKRPFANIEEMASSITANWNKKVPKNGRVFVLGDFSFCSKDRLKELLLQLNGNIYIVPGNHDNKAFLNWANTEKLCYVLPQYYELRHNHEKMVLCHFPFDTWNRSHHGSIHLHGHSHGALPSEGRNRLDVGIDARPNKDYSPWSLAEVKEHFQSQRISNELNTIATTTSADD